MKNLLFSITAVCLLFLISCGKDDAIEVDPIDKLGLQKIGEQIQGDTRVIVWGDKSIETGYEKLYIQLLNQSGSSITDGQVGVKPMMEMNMNGHAMSHSAPADATVLGNEKLFETGVVFTMPSDGEHGIWKLAVTHTASNKDVSDFEIPIQVKANDLAKVKTVTTEEGDRYVLSFYLSDNPKIGVNDASFTLHKQESMMSFPPFQSALMTVDPRMPDMDNHGSPNNVNPVHKANGHYIGKLNYTMSGLWRIHVEVTVEGEKISESFDQKF